MRSYQFHLVIFSFRLYTLFHTFPHSKSTKSNDFTSTYSFAYTRNFVLEGSYIHRRWIRRQLEVCRASVSLAFSRRTNLLELDFVCAFRLFIANAPPWPAQLHAQKPHGLHLDLNFVLPWTVLTFHPPISHPTMSSRPHILSRYHHRSIIRTRLASFSPPPKVYVRSAFSYVPQKWTRAIRRIFPFLALTLFIWLRRFEIA